MSVETEAADPPPTPPTPVADKYPSPSPPAHPADATVPIETLAAELCSEADWEAISRTEEEEEAEWAREDGWFGGL